ncbi:MULTISPECIES: holo-ACP synthase [unclassified Luteococcus]|uniref:holo-ACP synthase n=1 Tax=unclassified Luteococcus TaxID=2639923 RepID=UPI00313CB69F
MRPGVDLVRVAEVAAALDRFGPRYLRRVYRPGEVTDPARLAEHFAGKEAIFKALRCDPRLPLPWRDIEVVRGPDAAMSVVLHGHARRWAASQGITRIDLSTSQRDGVAMAFAIAH